MIHHWKIHTPDDVFPEPHTKCGIAHSIEECDEIAEFASKHSKWEPSIFEYKNDHST